MYDKKSATKWLWFLLILGTLGCKSKKQDSFRFDITNNRYKDSGGVKHVPVTISQQVVSVDSIGSIASVIVLDTEAVVGSIDKVEMANDNIYIMDKGKAKGFFCFSLDGRLKWKYTRQGRGQQHYIRLGDFQIDHQNVWLYDNFGRKLIVLDSAGRFIKEVILPAFPLFYPDYFFIDADHNLIIYNEDFGDYDKFPYAMTTLDSNGNKVLSCNFPQTDNPAVGRWMTAASPMQNFESGKGFFLTKPMNDTIFAFEKGVFSRKYYIDFGKFQVPEKLRLQNGYTLEKFRAAHYMSNIERVAEGDSLISFLFGFGGLPAFALVDKQTLHSRGYAIALFNIDGYYQTLLPIGSSNGRVITQVDPLSIIRFYEMLRQKDSALSETSFIMKLQKEMPAISELRNKISLNSNPILVLINFSRNKLFNNENE
jgi:hypothetical protein